MKIIFLSIGLMLASVTAFATVQSKASPDKPWRIYVKKDTQNFHYNWNAIAYDYYEGAHILVGTASGAQDYNHTWIDGVGGGGSWATDHTDSTVSDNPLYTGSDHYHVDGQFNWAPTKWPTFTNCTETLTGDTWLLGWADIDVGLDPWQSDQVPLIQNEHCQIVDTGSTWTGTNDYYHYDFNRTADTVWHVQTGGKAVPGLLNLWQFSGSAFVHINKFAVPPFQDLSSYEITNKTQIAIGSLGNLKADGNLWLTLPDDVEKDITLNVAGKDFYTFTVSGQKYELTITAATNNCTPIDLSATRPEFCVGQNVSFVPSWGSGSPPFTNAIYRWHLPSKFVNEPFAYSTYCNSYRLNTDLLTNRTISVWYVNDNGGACSIGMSLQFANGQTVPFAAAGNFTVYKPTATNEVDHAGMVSLDGNFYLQDAPVDFYGHVQSAYHGYANWTQIVNRDCQEAFYVELPSYGQDWLDTHLFYANQADTTVVPGLDNRVPLNDAPEVLIDVHVSNIDKFKTYLMFKPDGDSIYVPIGRVDWGWHGDAFPGILETNCGITAPQYTSTNEFPVWSNVYTSSEH